MNLGKFVAKKLKLSKQILALGLVVAFTFSFLGTAVKVHAADDVVLSFPDNQTVGQNHIASLDLSLTVNNEATPVIMVWDLNFDPSVITAVNINPSEGGPATQTANKSISCAQNSGPGDYLCSVDPFSTGDFSTPFQSGVLATIEFTFAHPTNQTSATISFSSLAAQNAEGNTLAISGTPVTVNIPAPIPEQTAPVITGVTTSYKTVSWTTDKPSTSQVEYGDSTEYSASSSLDTTLVTDHSLTVPAWQDGIVYHFRVLSADSFGNVGASGDKAIFVESPTIQTQTSGGGGGGWGNPVPFTPLNFTAIVSLNAVLLKWDNPGAVSGWTHTVVVRKEGTTPPALVQDGTEIYSGQSNTFADAAVEMGKSYSYSVFAGNISKMYSSPASRTITIGSVLGYTTTIPSTQDVKEGKDVLKKATSTEPTVKEKPTTTEETLLGFKTYVVHSGEAYFEISGGKRHGVVSPEILFSNGYDFSDAFDASEVDLALPSGENLVPGEGALIKTPDDKTVYLVSEKSLHGFISAPVFLSSGFSFSSVLVVDKDEFNLLPKGEIITSASNAHLPGVKVAFGETIGLIGKTERNLYPSLEVYNSWQHDNDFSGVVVANEADKLLPVGEVIKQRYLTR